MKNVIYTLSVLLMTALIAACKPPSTPFNKKNSGSGSGGGSGGSSSTSGGTTASAYVCQNPRTDLDYRLGNANFAECEEGINYYGQKFVSTARQRISVIELDLVAFGNPGVMNVKVEIRADKTPCSRDTHCPEGAVLASSNWINGAQMSYRQLVPFRLTDNPYLEAGQIYWVVLIAERKATSGNLAVYYDNSNPYSQGHMSFYDLFGKQWIGSSSSASGWDLNMRTQTCNEN